MLMVSPQTGLRKRTEGPLWGLQALPIPCPLSLRVLCQLSDAETAVQMKAAAITQSCALGEYGLHPCSPKGLPGLPPMMTEFHMVSGGFGGS